MAPPFDQAVMVDWSASSSPRTGRDSIWAGVRRRGAGRSVVVNPPTRMAAARWLGDLLDAAVAEGRRTLVGLDFSFGYPAGFARHLAERRGEAAPELPAWRATWSLLAERLRDDERNANNRFAVADALNAESGTCFFWGRPEGDRYDRLSHLPSRKPAPEGLRANPCAALRWTERCCGRGIKSGWQLYGGVTVGSQVLTGPPYVADLAGRLGAQLAVWPFETGFGTDPFVAGAAPATVVVAEVWPSAFPADLGAAAVRDEAQVLATLEALVAAGDETWRRWLDPPSVGALDAHARADVLTEEGWILGIE